MEKHGAAKHAAARIAEVRAHFAAQGAACGRLGSAFYAGLLPALGEGLEAAGAAGRQVFDWPGDVTDDALALRLAGTLNALARSGRAPGLAAVWPGLGRPAEGACEADGRAAAAHALAALAAAPEAAAEGLGGAPQTNEARRASALHGALRLLRARGWDRVELLEIGASAGLGLGPDRRRWALGPAGEAGPAGAPRLESLWRGDWPVGPAAEIVARAGCDLAPVDPGDPAARARMLAYIWPDQPARRAMLEAALDDAAAAPWRVERASAAPWLARRLALPPPAGAGRLVWHSVMLQYLPATDRAAVEAALTAAGARATPERPLARLSFEHDGAPRSAALVLTVWPGGAPEALGRADFHGRWVGWGEGAGA